MSVMKRQCELPASRHLYSVDEAAAYLSIRPGTLRNWLSVRRLTYVKVGRLTRISVAVLDRFIADNTVEAVEK